VDCPTLKWSWGIIPQPVAENIVESGNVLEESISEPDAAVKPSDEEAPTTPKPPSSQLSESETVVSTPATIGPSQQSSAPSSTETLLATPQKTHQLPQMPSSSAGAVSRGPTETSRIRLYFNSPVELEDRPAVHVTPVADQTNQHQQRRGGKRKKEHEEGEPEEGSKRKKEDNDSTGHHTHILPAQLSNESMMKGADRAPNGSTHSTLEPSGIGAKRKAHSLSGDEEDGDRNREHDHDHALTLPGGQPRNETSRSEVDHDAETEYAGSPPQDVFLEYPEPPRSVFSTAEGEGGVEGEDDEIISASQAPTEVADPDPHEQPYYTLENDGPDASHEDDVSAASEIGGNIQAGSDVRDHNDETTAHSCDDSLQAADRKCDDNHDDKNTADACMPGQTSSSTSAAAHVTRQPVNAVPAAPAAVAPTGRTPSPNRISISYAGSSRRLVLDAEIVQRVKIFRAEGRIEVRFVLVKSSSPSFPAPGLVSSAMSDPLPSSTDPDSGSGQAVRPTPAGAPETANDIGEGEDPPENKSGSTPVVAGENVDKVPSESPADANVEHANGVVESSSPRPANPPTPPQSALQPAASHLQSHVGTVQCRGILASHLSLRQALKGQHDVDVLITLTYRMSYFFLSHLLCLRSPRSRFIASSS